MYGTTNAPFGVTYEEFADLAAVTNYVIPASGWVENDGKFVNTITASFKSTDKPIISFIDPDDVEDTKAYDKACGLVRSFETGDGTLTGTAIGGAPQVDIHISAKGF